MVPFLQPQEKHQGWSHIQNTENSKFLVWYIRWCCTGPVTPSRCKCTKSSSSRELQCHGAEITQHASVWCQQLPHHLHAVQPFEYNTPSRVLQAMVNQKEQGLQGQIQQLRTCRQSSPCTACQSTGPVWIFMPGTEPPWGANRPGTEEPYLRLSVWYLLMHSCVMPHRFAVNIDKAHRKDLLSEYRNMRTHTYSL